MPMRPPSSARIAILKPSPSGAEQRVVADARSRSRNTCADGAPRMPSLSSGGPSLSPGVSIGTRNAVMPRLPFAASVVAKTMHDVGDRARW